MIKIRRCHSEEIGAVTKFLDQHWQRGHILSVNQQLMDWQHLAEDGNYDYLLAWKDNTLVGILGYIVSRRFDISLTNNNVIWLALWKIIDDCGVAGLGLRMLHELGRIEPHIAIAVNGINATHPPMYKALGYTVGELKQYWISNPEMSCELVSNLQVADLPVPRGEGATITEMHEEALRELDSEKINSQMLPDKTPLYFITRFLQHPVYKYRVFLVSHGSYKDCLIATRVASHEELRALRIVDFSGEPEIIAYMGKALATLMVEENVQHADWWQYGVPACHFIQAGFSPVDPLAKVVVPNFFEPFLAKNGRILCAYKSNAKKPIVFFRADGDQDRPNLLP